MRTARKSIRIDAEAYERLARACRDGESFSDLIKRVVPKPFDLHAWLARARSDGISDETAAAIEKQVQSRRARSSRKRRLF